MLSDLTHAYVCLAGVATEFRLLLAAGEFSCTLLSEWHRVVPLTQPRCCRALVITGT